MNNDSNYIVRDSKRAKHGLKAGQYAVQCHLPFEKSEEDEGLIPVPGFYESFDIILASATKDWLSGDYIPTTAKDIYAKVDQKFLFDKPGKLILPENPKTGNVVRVADFNEKLKSENYYVLDVNGKTIAKNQIKDGVKASTAINLNSLQGYRVFDFVYYEDYDDWAIYLDGKYRRFNLQTNSPYIFTTREDLQIQAYQRILIKEPGVILLWTPKVLGEYATIVDDLGLLKTQNNYLLAPDRHLITGQNITAGKESQGANLRNDRKAVRFDVKYFADKLWTLGAVTNG